ncbi:hypothetical protein AB0I10_27670 [Streptomyces sp. NPDC050636]|uniref:hypothetical protein n=1 Tax=Streptomyces sp. NPDC050636 TaxID=3154510 RepID=UPI00343BFF21
MHRTTPSANISSVTWLRPEFVDREDELINLAAGADLVGVSRSAVSNWAARHANFPKIALLTGIGKRRNKYVPREEFLTFARTQLAKQRKAPTQTAPRRPSAEIHAERVEHYQRQVERLTEREAKHAARLVQAQQSLRIATSKLRKARAQLRADIAAARRAAIPGPAD